MPRGVVQIESLTLLTDADPQGSDRNECCTSTCMLPTPQYSKTARQQDSKTASNKVVYVQKKSEARINPQLKTRKARRKSHLQIQPQPQKRQRKNPKMSSKQRKAKRRSSSSSSLKILVKCSWSGARLPAASHLSSTSTLLDVISSLTSPLPPIISNPNPTITIPQEQEPSIVYIRTTVYKRDWATTAIRDVLGVDSDAACSSVLLTLKLPSQTMTNTDSIHSSTQPLEVLQQVVEPMEIDDDSAVPPPPFSSLVNSSPPIPLAANVPPHVPTPVITPTLAIQHLLSSNFDSASKDCLLTLLKLVDNILAQPHNPKVRTVKMSNAVLKRKIGAAKGGWDILVSLGFDYQPSQPLQGMGATIGMSSLSSSSSTSSLQTKSHDNGVLTLRPERENGSELESARMYMVQMLTQELGLLPQNLPSPPTPKTTPAALRRHTSSTSSTRSTSHSSTSSFDPFKTSSYNTQSAAVGANANSIAPDGKRSLSTTERQLQVLKQKQAQMEERNKALLGDNRSMVAFRPGETSTGSLGSSSGGGGGAMGGREGKGDASLLAGMMKRKEEERRKKEEGGFTTKAMRKLWAWYLFFV